MYAKSRFGAMKSRSEGLAGSEGVGIKLAVRWNPHPKKVEQATESAGAFYFYEKLYIFIISETFSFSFNFINSFTFCEAFYFLSIDLKIYNIHYYTL